MSLRPPAFIRDRLDGVGFPCERWWTPIAATTLAAADLVTGVWSPGIAAVAHAAGVIAYFLCAAAAHIRAPGVLGELFGNAGALSRRTCAFPHSVRPLVRQE